MSTPFSTEFGSAFLADITSRIGIDGLWQLVRQFLGRTSPQISLPAEAIKAGVEMAGEKGTREAVRDLRGYFFRMHEPWKTRLNNIYREAREGKFEFSEDDFVKLLSKALEFEETWEKKERYLKYFSLLSKKPRRVGRGKGKEPIILPSIEEELDKLHEGSLFDLRGEKEAARLVVKKAITALKKEEKRLDGAKRKFRFGYGFYHE